MEQRVYLRDDNTVLYKLIGILIFLIALNFFNASYYFALAVVVIVFAFSNKIRFPVTVNLLLILFFCLLYISFTFDGLNGAVKISLFALLYSVGMILTTGHESEKRIIYYILIMAFGCALHGILNCIINFSTFSSSTIVERNLPDIWTGTIMSATGVNSVFTIFIGVIFYIFFIRHDKKLFLASLIALIIMVYLNLMNASRTVFILTTLTLLTCILSAQLLLKKKVIRIWIVLIMITLIVLLGYFHNWFGFADFLEHSPLFDRLNVSQNYFEDDRFNLQIFYLQHIFDYPFGGRHIFAQVNNYAHNILLDVADNGGILPGIFLLFFLIVSVVNMLKIILNKKVPYAFKVLIIGVYTSIYLQFNIEPILYGESWLFALFCLIVGMIDKYCFTLKVDASI